MAVQKKKAGTSATQADTKKIDLAKNLVEITTFEIRPWNGDGKLMAFVDMLIADSIVVKGLRLVDSVNGPFVSWPSKQEKSGEWYDQVFPINKEARDIFNAAVIKEYDNL